MNKSYKSIPQILIGKTIAFTGTFPGVGKSYTFMEFCHQLDKKGYRYFNTGTTQKAASNIGSNITVAAKSLDSKNNWKVKTSRRGKTVHSQTEGFYLIDEAFMDDQQTIDMLKEAYPRCCFILFGDPMQFEPASGLEPITHIDLIISLEKMMRVKDQDLIDALQMIKEGKLPKEFMYKHCDNKINDSMLMLCYNKATSNSYSDMFDDRPGVTLYKSKRRESYNIENDDQTYFSVLDEVCNGDIWRLKEITNNYNKDLENFNLYTLERISGQRKVITVDYNQFKHHFEKKNAVNTHKVQGDTIRKDASDIIVWFDKNIEIHNQTLLRFLYVALSRVEYSSQIHFCIEQVEEVINKYKENGPLFDYLDIAHNQNVVHTSSSKVCSLDILDFILNNIKNNVSNVTKNPVYINDSLLHLVQGNKVKENIDTIKVMYQIKYDQHLSDRLQSDLDNRKVQSIPNKGQCFITINNTLDGKNHMDKVTEYNWFVMEIDHIPGISDDKVTDYIYRNFVSSSSRAKYKDARNACFRIVYSGNHSYHFWFYIDNDELNRYASRDLYKAVHKYLNDTFFNGWADEAISSPEHFVRAPGKIRPDTNKEQTLMSCKGKKVLHIDNIMDLLPSNKEEIKPTVISVTTNNGSVEQAFNTYKDDIPTTNGGRGKIILSKLLKEQIRGFLNKTQLEELCVMLCTYANCPEKINHLKSYISEW